MMVELGVGILAVGVLGYAVYWQRRRSRMRAKKSNWLGVRVDSLWNEMHREELRLKRLKKKIEEEEVN